MILGRLLQGDNNLSKNNVQEVRRVRRKDPERPLSLLQGMFGSDTVLFHKDGRSSPDAYARSLLGEQVRVVLGYESVNDEQGIPTVCEGQLLGFGDGGDFEILEDDGFVHYCWPMLKVEPR